jgi:urease accessory protein
MKLRSALVGCVAITGALVSYDAGAHVVNGGSGWTSGVAHPFLGVDHLLAMLAVGFWAAQMGGRALWAVPLTFVSIMAGGALIAIAGIPLPAVESGVAASVLALGLLVAFAVRLPVATGMLVAGTFALFHGHAHAAELPAVVSPWVYAAGFLLATGALHASGIAAARALDVERWRIAGTCVAIAGAAFVVAS